VPSPDATPALPANEVDAALSDGEPPREPVSMDGLDRAVDAFDVALAAMSRPAV